MSKVLIMSIMPAAICVPDGCHDNDMIRPATLKQLKRPGSAKMNKIKKKLKKIRLLTFLSAQVSLKLDLLIQYFKQLHGAILTAHLKHTTLTCSEKIRHEYKTLGR